MTDHDPASSSSAARCAIVTFSDTRTPKTDAGGNLLARLVEESGHTVVNRGIVREDPALITRHMRTLLDRADIDAIITTGGTGIARRDVTAQTVQKLLDETLPGFGELFRLLSFQQVGSAAMLSRAIGGLASGKLVFCLPGSPKAVELGFARLIGPEMTHLLAELRK